MPGSGAAPASCEAHVVAAAAASLGIGTARLGCVGAGAHQENLGALAFNVHSRPQRATRAPSVGMCGEARPSWERAIPSRALCDITNTGGLGDRGKPIVDAVKAQVGVSRSGSLLKPSAHALGGSRSLATCSTSFCSGSASSTAAGTGTSASTMDIEDEDVRMEDDDPQAVNEYAYDIYRNLSQAEAASQPRTDFMKFQPDVNQKMRAILVDWLVEIHTKYKLKTETLFLAVNLVDRFLEVKQVPRQRFQLCGITAMLIAAKFEEIYPPEVQDFAYIADNAYTKDDILDMEVAMLTKLKFLLSVPTAAHFIERYSRISGCTADQHRHLMQYLLELSLPEYKMARYPQSQLAAAAVYLSNKLVKKQPAWTAALIFQTQMTESMVKGCARDMCGVLEAARDREERCQLRAVRRKFSHRKFSEVSRWSF